MMSDSKYCIGIDLGTTNSSLAFIDTESEEPKAITMDVEQVTASGETAKMSLLPSAVYVPGDHELAENALALPWNETPDTGVGQFALSQGTSVPHRLITSAKSWLSHSGIDRRSSILPVTDDEDVTRYSPVQASSMILNHLKDAWNHEHAKEKGAKFEDQQIILTVPASFDAVARDLTLEAARESGIEDITILEEPQAALYSWIGQNDEWRKEVTKGDVILVIDVGGGTTDFSLMKVDEEDGDLTLERFAAGNHILLGGDNFDLTLARHLEASLKKRLSSWQLSVACHGCRKAKEEILNSEDVDEVPVVIPGRGSSLVGGSIKGKITRKQVMSVLCDGFFPMVKVSDKPVTRLGGGLQEMGLPYEADPAITKHLAAFLSAHNSDGEKAFVHPSAILFNGGVFKATILRDRIIENIESWMSEDEGSTIRTLKGFELDLAVARGGAEYGRVRRGQGFRIRGGTSRSYYVGVEIPMPAVPGLEPPVKAICIAPFGMEEGSSCSLPESKFGLNVGSKAKFRFFSSSTRQDDEIGDVIEDWEDRDIEEIAPIETTLASDEHEEGAMITVTLNSEVTETGTLQLWAANVDNDDERYRLEFTIRQEDE